uniref:Uncharacterized protein n=1 Tax=Timema monikensis TaxID=170555 RepID=A0A7R9EH90_9NEOP|nr:unnamed protein product [Timema monikensis]
MAVNPKPTGHLWQKLDTDRQISQKMARSFTWIFTLIMEGKGVRALLVFADGGRGGYVRMREPGKSSSVTRSLQMDT